MSGVQIKVFSPSSWLPARDFFLLYYHKSFSFFSLVVVVVENCATSAQLQARSERCCAYRRGREKDYSQ